MSHSSRFRLVRGALLAAALLASAHARADPAPACELCAQWNAPQKPFQVFGNTYYVGVTGLASVLITSPSGHVLVDGGLPQSAPLIAANIRALGFKLDDIKLILNSHAHFDHAGGIAELQRLSGALVVASPSAALALAAGQVGPDDPQYGAATPYAPVLDMRLAHDGEAIAAGAIEVTAHVTPGHSPGGLSWSWKSCEGKVCANVVFADSLNPYSRKGFKFGASEDYPNALQDFQRSYATLAALPCDIMLTGHTDAELFTKQAKPREAGKNPFVDPEACRKYVAAARDALTKRIATER
ncbi:MULTISPECIES: subclass B3 metallo-beta-lactamase [unclassified Janthinobacterium]|uniref:subclass B3 metallo-beta-lactamase n=1 Tax=unclassified Janthinobacterium TaxID=2610881 RepID=UPI0009D93998|nr:MULTISPECIES: subclass B3 metallo-beta-lactamase [unclassified Janthinobacterium]MEC5160507.1 metallo-beta-lactamase class B [Janthinobacterium sp. CG_S6]